MIFVALGRATTSHSADATLRVVRSMPHRGRLRSPRKVPVCVRSCFGRAGGRLRPPGVDQVRSKRRQLASAKPLARVLVRG